MKTVSLDTLHGGSIDELRREIDVQKSLDHPNIVRLFEYFEDPHQHLIHIIMELCTGGALVSRMKIHRHGYTEDAARKLVSKVRWHEDTCVGPLPCGAESCLLARLVVNRASVRQIWGANIRAGAAIALAPGLRDYNASVDSLLFV